MPDVGDTTFLCADSVTVPADAACTFDADAAVADEAASSEGRPGAFEPVLMRICL